jgi:hypothetical protein
MKTLYKSVSSRGAVQAIAAGSLKFTNIDELNDPSELAPIMIREAVHSSLAAVRKDVSVKPSPHVRHGFAKR